ncbi:MAG: phenylacetate--CoA ligase family protein [Candidatus Rokuibacteriota bacterium]
MPALDWAALRGRRGVDLTVWPRRYDPAYRPPPEAAHWLPEVECADPAARDALVFAKLTRQVRYAWERSAFYRRKWQDAGVSPDALRSLDDLARFPVVQKAELRAAQAAAPPFGDYLCIEPSEVARTTGSASGRPTRASSGARASVRAIASFSGEPGAGIPATRALIEETFGGRCVDMGSMAEMSPWMTNGECGHRTGMHLWQDLVYTQVCDPETFRPRPYGAEGTPVYTHLERTSQPMIRLVSDDRARWVDTPCPCGRTYPRLPDGLYGRSILHVQAG